MPRASLFWMGSLLIGLPVAAVLMWPSAAMRMDENPVLVATAPSQTTQDIPPHKPGPARIEISHTAVTSPPPLPASLQGTQQEVRLTQTANGDLQVEPALLLLFDYYLAGIEEEPLEQVIQRIRWDLNQQLSGKANQQALALLEHYLDYRLELPHLAVPAGMDAEALRQRLQAVRGLRQQHFGLKDSALLFADDEAADQRMIEHLANVQDHPGTDDAANTLTSPADRELALFEQVRQMRADGASDAQILQLREATLGAEAAQALAELDQQQAQWQARLAAFAQQRRAVLDSDRPTAEQQQAIEHLLEAQFDERERIRVRALQEDG